MYKPPSTLHVPELGTAGALTKRDLWSRTDAGIGEAKSLAIPLRPHQSELFTLRTL